MGTVTAPEQAEDEAFPRRVSMTWGEVCDVEVGREATLSLFSQMCGVRDLLVLLGSHESRDWAHTVLLPGPAIGIDILVQVLAYELRTNNNSEPLLLIFSFVVSLHPHCSMCF